MAVVIPHQLLVGDDFAEYMHTSETQARVIPASNYRDLLKRAMYEPAKVVPGLPWSKTLEHIAFRAGEVSLWAGANGSGKSMLLSHVMLGLVRQRERACIASFEMKPVRQLERMARQTAMNAKPAETAIDAMFDWLTGRLWFYDQQGPAKAAMVYAVCRYAADRLKCSQIVIDSLMKCVRGEDDYNGQKDFVDELTSIARDTGLHIHLVHHIKKPDDESRVPSKYDAKGSGSISDQVDNVFMFWRNKPKERIADREARGEKMTEKDLAALKHPDALLVCDKQRNGDFEGRISLWFHVGALQYCADPSRRPMELIQNETPTR